MDQNVDSVVILLLLHDVSVQLTKKLLDMLSKYELDPINERWSFRYSCFNLSPALHRYVFSCFLKLFLVGNSHSSAGISFQAFRSNNNNNNNNNTIFRQVCLFSW